MMKQQLEQVYLSLQYTDGKIENIELSPTQLATIIKILGLNNFTKDEIYTEKYKYTCYSDDTLKRFFAMESNPLRLTEK